ALLKEQTVGLAADRNDSLWIATANGVLRVRTDKLRAGVLVDGDVREFGFADGLPGSEGVRRHKSVVADSTGRIWFSLNRSISVVDPARLVRASVTPVVHIQSISVDGSPVQLGVPVHVHPKPERITLRFVGISLSNPARVRFQYTLEGFERRWSQPAARRE